MSDAPAVKKRRIVVKTVRVKKDDLGKLTNAVRDAVVDDGLLANVESEVVLSGPWNGTLIAAEPSRIVKARIFPSGEPTLPPSILSSKRPAKKSTALLWSRRRFLTRLYELKKKSK